MSQKDFIFETIFGINTRLNLIASYPSGKNYVVCFLRRDEMPRDCAMLRFLRFFSSQLENHFAVCSAGGLQL